MQTQLSLLPSNLDTAPNPGSSIGTFGKGTPFGGHSDGGPATHPFRLELKAMQDSETTAQKPDIAALALVLPEVKNLSSLVSAPVKPIPEQVKNPETSEFFEGDSAIKPSQSLDVSGHDHSAETAPAISPMPTDAALAVSHSAVLARPAEASQAEPKPELKPEIKTAHIAAPNSTPENTPETLAKPLAQTPPSRGKPLPSGKNMPAKTGIILPQPATSAAPVSGSNSSQTPSSVLPRNSPDDSSSPLVAKGNAKKAAQPRNPARRVAIPKPTAPAGKPVPELGDKQPLAQVALNIPATGDPVIGKPVTGKPINGKPANLPTPKPGAAAQTNGAPIAPAPKPAATQIKPSANVKAPQTSPHGASFFPNPSPKQAAEAGIRIALNGQLEQPAQIARQAGNQTAPHVVIAPATAFKSVTPSLQIFQPLSSAASTPSAKSSKASATHIAPSKNETKMLAKHLAADLAPERGTKPSPEMTQKSAPQSVDIGPKTMGPAIPSQPQSQTSAPVMPLAINGAVLGSLVSSAGSVQAAGQAAMPDLETMVEKLSAARVLARADKSSMAINHPDFGRVTVEFSTGSSNRLGLDLPDAPAELRQAVAQNFNLNNAANNAANSAARGETPRGETGQSRSDQNSSSRSETNENQGAGSESSRGSASSNAREQAQTSGQQGQTSRTTQRQGFRSLTTPDESAGNTAQGTSQGTWA